MSEEHENGDEEQMPDDIALGDDTGSLLERDLRRPGLFVWLLTIAAGISGLLFGCTAPRPKIKCASIWRLIDVDADDTGVISATLVSIGSGLSGRNLTTLDKSLITSCTSFFALLASPVTGILADKLGRKKVILIADVLFVLGAGTQAVTSSVWGMIAGRSIVGLAVGAASLVVPLYISELSPAPFRGRLVTLSILFVTLGQVVSYVVGYLLSQHAQGWRWMVGVGALPAGVQFLLLTFMPETPRWLVKMERRDDARQVLNKVFGRGVEVQAMVDGVLRAIEVEVREEEEAKQERFRKNSGHDVVARFATLSDNWSELFRTGANRRALSIACLLQGLQQLCGFVSEYQALL